MSITLINSPQKYSTANNPAIYQVLSNNADIVFFRTNIKQAGTNATVQVLDMYCTPDYPLGSYINLNSILNNVVKPQFEPDINTLYKPLATPIFNYYLTIQEQVFVDSTSTISGGSSYSTSTATTFNAGLSRIDYNSFNYLDYVITTSGSPVSFLTNKPDSPKVNDESSEHLYFLNDKVSGLKVQVKTYNNSGGLIHTYTQTITGSANNNLYRLNISPKALAANLSVSFSATAFYTVQVLNSSNVAKTALRTYLYGATDCNLEYANIFFENSLGQFDAYQFVNPQETLAVTKASIKKNIYGLDSNNVYADNDNGIYNPSDLIYNSVSTKSYKAYSKPLTDVEGIWLKELFQAKTAYLELPDGSFAPIVITNINYAVQRNKYNRDNLVVVELNYQLTDGL